MTSLFEVPPVLTPITMAPWLFASVARRIYDKIFIQDTEQPLRSYNFLSESVLAKCLTGFRINTDKCIFGKLPEVAAAGRWGEASRDSYPKFEPVLRT